MSVSKRLPCGLRIVGHPMAFDVLFLEDFASTVIFWVILSLVFLKNFKTCDDTTPEEASYISA